MRSTWPLVILSVWAAAPASADEPPKADDAAPEAVVRAAMAAARAGKFEDAARVVHPDDLRKFRAAVLDAGRSADRAGNGKLFLAAFPDTPTVADLGKLDDVRLYATFLRGTLGQPAWQGLRDGEDVKVVGRVPEGPDVVHVVFRAAVARFGGTYSVVVVHSLRRTDAGWRMLLSGEVDGLALAIKDQLGEAATEPPGVKGKPVDPPVGEWEIRDTVWKGTRVPMDVPGGEVVRLRLTRDSWTSNVPLIKREDKAPAVFTEAGGLLRVDLHLDEPGKEERGIWKVEGDTLTICMGLPGEPRPADFKCPIGSKRFLWVLRRVKKE